MQLSKQELKNHHCLENIDNVPGDPETTEFRRYARYHQARWRKDRGFKIGSQPMRPKEGKKSRPLGSRIDLDFAKESGANFLNNDIRRAVKYRLEHPQPYQTLDEDRLYCDLLSSMPMCFNLFGTFQWDLGLADRFVHTWLPNVPGRVCKVHFEWSPGRSVPGEYLENRSAFDVAFEIELKDGSRGILGIETKYHEYCKKEIVPSQERFKRYYKVASDSGTMSSAFVNKILGTDLQQIWLDHLLALSMLQHPSDNWKWVHFALVHPAKNPSYTRASERYRSMLRGALSFSVHTLESILDTDILDERLRTVFSERYIW